MDGGFHSLWPLQRIWRMDRESWLRGRHHGKWPALAFSLEGFFPLATGGGLEECFVAWVACNRMGIVRSPKMVWLRGCRCTTIFSSPRRAYKRITSRWFFSHSLTRAIRRSSSREADCCIAFSSGITPHIARTWNSPWVTYPIENFQLLEKEFVGPVFDLAIARIQCIALKL